MYALEALSVGLIWLVAMIGRATGHLFPTLRSTTSRWYPETGHSGNVYTEDVGKCSAWELVIKRFRAHHEY